MNISELLMAELKRESVSTKKLLECVPEGKNDWKPHEKSTELSKLASHVAEIPHWIEKVLVYDEFDMVATPFERKVCNSREELLDYFETKLNAAVAALEKANDEDLAKDWTFRAGDHVILNSSKYNAIRSMGLNHQIHHRAQLGVYLRLLDIAIPGVYGPSADDRARMEAQK
ncbi:MAG: DinB family protein [Chitinophagaceae bacterium]|nr:DinB family protein [Chitinophagaceae bacterium]MCB9046460.1 hypothetical protein [Chitinophagales bacterium]